MKRKNMNFNKHVWVAVKVERGYVCEARVFQSASRAERTERRWQTDLNPDYDEAAVIKSRIIP